MAKLLKLRRGSTSQHSSFTGAEGEVTIDTTKDTAVVHDGAQAGGRPLAREDMSNVSSASIAGRLGTDSISVDKIAGGTLPTDVKVGSANITNGTIINADINSSAAIAGTKISPSFGSQNISTSGTIDSGNISVAGTAPMVGFTDTNANSDYRLIVDGGVFYLQDTTNSNATRFELNSSGTGTFSGNLNVGAGVDVTGNITSTGNLTISNTYPSLFLFDTDNNDDFSVQNQNGLFAIRDETDSANRFTIGSDGTCNIAGNLNANAGIDVTGNMTVTGTVDGRDVAADGTKLDAIEASATADQTGAEILSLISGSNIYTSGNLGRDAGDQINFTTDTRMDIVINGNNEFRFEADGDFHADGDVIAQSTTTTSDRKLKENIEVIPNALDKVQALNGVSFDWKKTGEKSAGVIAQDVQEVLPEAVKEVTPIGGGDSHLTVNYHALTSILIESIKELKAEIEELKGGK